MIRRIPHLRMIALMVFAAPLSPIFPWGSLAALATVVLLEPDMKLEVRTPEPVLGNPCGDVGM